MIERSDLQGAAADLGLRLRVGERRSILESLLSQDPEAAPSWIAGETRRWARLPSALVVGDGRCRGVLDWWANAAKSLIVEALAEAREVAQPRT